MSLFKSLDHFSKLEDDASTSTKVDISVEVEEKANEIATAIIEEDKAFEEAVTEVEETSKEATQIADDIETLSFLIDNFKQNGVNKQTLSLLEHQGYFNHPSLQANMISLDSLDTFSSNEELAANLITSMETVKEELQEMLDKVKEKFKPLSAKISKFFDNYTKEIEVKKDKLKKKIEAKGEPSEAKARTLITHEQFVDYATTCAKIISHLSSIKLSQDDPLKAISKEITKLGFTYTNRFDETDLQKTKSFKSLSSMAKKVKANEASWTAKKLTGSDYDLVKKTALNMSEVKRAQSHLWALNWDTLMSVNKGGNEIYSQRKVWMLINAIYRIYSTVLSTNRELAQQYITAVNAYL